MKLELKVAKWIGYIATVVGILRLADYYFYGNASHNYALAWAFHALIAGPIVVWLSIRISKKES